MNLFETTAYAAPAGAAGGDSGLINLLFLGGFKGEGKGAPAQNPDNL